MCRPRFLGQITPTRLKRPVGRQGVVLDALGLEDEKNVSTNIGHVLHSIPNERWLDFPIDSLHASTV